MAYQTANVVGLGAVVSVGQRFSFRSRIIPGFAIYIACMILVVSIHSNLWRIIFVAVLGLTDAVVQGSIFAQAAMYGPKYVGALMAGQGWSAIVASGLHIITKASIDQDPEGIKRATVIFFAVGSFLVFLCMVCYLFVLDRSPVTRHFLDRAARVRDAKFERSLNERAPLAYATLAPDAYHNMQHSLRAPGDRLLVADDAATFDSGPEAEAGAVTRKLGPMLSAVFTIFLVTLALFPGITSRFESQSEHLNKTGWYVVAMVTVFDVGDLIGRLMPDKEVFMNLIGDRALYVGTALRLLFVPAFILVIKGHVPNDAAQYAIMLAFAITNGYFSTLTMCRGPLRVDAHEREMAGGLMVYALTAGLTAGVWSGYGLGKAF